jgi:hypothetical protein
MRSFYLIVITLLLVSLGLLDAASTSPGFTATPATVKRANVDTSNADATYPVSGLDGMQ